MKTLKDLCAQFDLLDAWRILNPDTRRYTWRRKLPEIHCRLDFFLVTQSLMCNITFANKLTTYKTDHSLACVAGGISRASAFVLVAKPWTRVAKPWEDWWRVELNSSWGFLNYAFTSAREFRIGWEYWNVNQMLINTSHLSEGKRFVFRMRRNV